MVVVVVVLEIQVTWEREAVCSTRYWPREMMVCRLDIYVYMYVCKYVCMYVTKYGNEQDLSKCMYVKALYVSMYVKGLPSLLGQIGICVYSVKEKVSMNVCM